MKGTRVSDEGEGPDARPTDSTSGTGFQTGKERRFQEPALFLMIILKGGASRFMDRLQHEEGNDHAQDGKTGRGVEGNGERAEGIFRLACNDPP